MHAVWSDADTTIGPGDVVALTATSIMGHWKRAAQKEAPPVIVSAGLFWRPQHSRPLA
jgi:hypothetical protein